MKRIIVFVACLIGLSAQDPSGYFTNPIGKGADPWVTKVNGFYYSSFGGAGKNSRNFITITKSNSLSKIGERKIVWVAPQEGWNSNCIWAPEVHHIRG
ncbi:MAG: hypothetical protein ACQUHE_18985, partial [Bacteroidia bacterium]